MLAFYIGVLAQFQAASFQVQLSANVSVKAVDDNLNAWATPSDVGNQHEVSGFWLGL